MIKLFFFLIIAAPLSVSAQTVEAYQIYNSKGKKVTYEKMVKDLTAAEFVFFGEYHDNPISHWLQLELTNTLFTKHQQNLMLGFEMFEQDQQLLLNDYLSGKTDVKVFEDSCRLWPNYKTDYKPLIDFAKEKQLQCIAANIPRRYASLAFKKGLSALDTLSEEEKSWITPLDFEVDTTLSQYAQLQEMAMHGMGDFVIAQAIKDATMAHFILKYMNPGNVMLHFNGAYHSDYHQSIIWYIRQAKPNALIKNITTVSQADVSKLEEENIGRADYIICVNSNMTSTH